MTTTTSDVAVAQEQFLSILPRIELHGRVYFRHLDADRREEAVAETVALAWAWFVRLNARGKNPLAFPSVLASYAARAVKCGRRVCGQLKTRDVMSPLAQRRRGYRVEALPASTATTHEERYSDVHGQRRQDALEERLRDNTQTPVPEQAAFRIDFPAWRLMQTDRTGRVIEAMAAGERTQDLARSFGLSPARISQMRRELYADWSRFQGDDLSAA